MIGAPLNRVDGRAKVTGAARYTYEERGREPGVRASSSPSTIAAGRVVVDRRA